MIVTVLLEVQGELLKALNSWFLAEIDLRIVAETCKFVRQSTKSGHFVLGPIMESRTMERGRQRHRQSRGREQRRLRRRRASLSMQIVSSVENEAVDTGLAPRGRGLSSNITL